MALQDFLGQSNNIQPRPIQPLKPVQAITPTVKPQTNLRDFTKQQFGEDIQKKKSQIGGLFRFLGKQLSKTHGVVAKELRGIGEAGGSLLAISSPKVTAKEGISRASKQLIEAQKGAGRVLAGKEETNLLEEFKKAGVEPNLLDKTMAIGGEIMLDPLWVIKPVKIAKKIGEITKLEKPAKALAQLIKEAPQAQKLKMIFSNTTGNKEFDTIVTKFRNLKEYREGELINDAVRLQKDIKKLGKGAEEAIVEGLENPTSLIDAPKEIKTIVEKLKGTYADLLEQSKKVGLKVGEIQNYAPHIRTKESFVNQLKEQFGLGAREFGKGAVEKGRKLKGTIKGLSEAGIDIFEKSPAIQLAKKGQMFAKAITSQEFAGAVKKFAVKDGVDVTHPALKGLKFGANEAKVIDNYYNGIKPEELKVIVKAFDKAQGWWKAQALISPSYHIRNTVGNQWNNFLAGVNPWAYGKAGLIQSGKLKDAALIKEMKELGVINQGWYAKDIGEEVIARVEGIGKWKTGLNPLSQQNYAFRLNKATGSVVENNARIAHYISKKASGLSPEEAAKSVKKYLFDYGDLTDVEKNIFKRAIPFYTWTRKNLPIQLEGLVTQPAKYSLPHKIISNLEAGTEVPDEKYMSHYISNNVPVRMRKNKEGNWEYFLLGNWLPYASAIDILDSPLENIVGMTTPFIKTPYEILANESTYFKDTLGEPSKIERRYKQQGEFLGMSLRKKNIQLLRNIRVLNDMNKWIDKYDPYATEDSWQVKLMNTLFGRAATYDIGQSKFFYDLDTDERISELKSAIKDANKRGFSEKANKLKSELYEFQQERNM